METSVLGISFSALKWLRVPRPSQTGQAPKGLLNENRRGSSSATARSHSGQECLAEKTRSGCSPFIQARMAISPPKRSAVSKDSAIRLPKSSRTLKRSTTTSMVCFFFLSSSGGVSISTISPSTRARTKPWLCSCSNRLLYSPLRSRTTGASSIKAVPSSRLLTASTISDTVCATIGKSCSGQYGVPTRAYKRRK